jgi:glycosyltransferase involved in cell wall biosynthesis
MLIPIYIYENVIDNQQTQKLCKTKIDEWGKYMTYFHAYSDSMDDEGLEEFKVYYSLDGNYCLVGNAFIEIEGYIYQFSFHTYKEANEKSHKIPIQFSQNPLKSRFGHVSDTILWRNKFSMNVVSDLYVDTNIRIQKNHSCLTSTPELSIVMAYFNRFEQTVFTLMTIEKSEYEKYEIIIVDDGSTENKNVSDLLSSFKNISLTLITLTPEYKKEKNYKNPCIAYNLGFQAARGSKIIIQNPECCHTFDIMKRAGELINNEDYLVFTCFAMRSEEDNDTLRRKMTQKNAELNTSGGVWYNHPTHRPKNLHFCSAISRENLYKYGRFDEAFAQGYWFDDDDFVMRLGRFLKIKTVQMDNDVPCVIHQWHPPFTASNSDFEELKERNKKILFEIYNIQKN